MWDWIVRGLVISGAADSIIKSVDKAVSSVVSDVSDAYQKSKRRKERISEIEKEIEKEWAATWKVFRKNHMPSQGFEDEWEEHKWEEDMKARKTWEMNRWMKRNNYDQVIAFLGAGNIAAAKRLLKQ